MKRLLFITFLLSGIVMLNSCNNGDYLADPQGNIPSPPGLDGVEEGVIDCRLDSMYRRFRLGVWAEAADISVISGTILSNNKPTENLLITIGNYKGPGTYTISDTMFGSSVIYTKLNAYNEPTDLYVAQDGAGFATITVTEAGATLKGTFYAHLFRLDSLSNPIWEDTLILRQGRFNVGKK